MMENELLLQLKDDQYDFSFVDHDRQIVRAIVFDAEGFLYFVRAHRNDDFGMATIIETSGGGVEANEDYILAIKRELKEELGADVEVLRKLGVVEDYYNIIHRHNINNYYLCYAKSFGKKELTYDEINSFHLETLKLKFSDALKEYEIRKVTKIGRLIYNRELPILFIAKKFISEYLKKF